MMKFCCIIIVFFLGSAVFSQNTWGVEGKFHSGVLAVHRPSISHLPQNNVFALEGSFFVDLHDSNTWARAFPIPRLGISAFYSQTGNPEILGSLFGTFVFGDLPFFRTKKHAFSARVGSGLAFATKVYDPIKNPKNNAMSAYANVVVQLSLKYSVFVKKSEFGIGLGLNHFSNGSNKLPNLGLNYPTIFLTYGQKRGEFVDKNKPKYALSWNAPWQFGANMILSAKEVYPTGGRKYPIFALNAFARKIFNPKSGVEFGLDGIYKSALLDYLPEYKKNPREIVQLGLFVGQVLNFDRFSTVLGMGAYFFDRYLPEDRFYHRIGMRYRFDNNVLMGLTLKSNWGKADYVEWSLGYVFNKKKS